MELDNPFFGKPIECRLCGRRHGEEMICKGAFKFLLHLAEKEGWDKRDKGSTASYIGTGDNL